MAVGGQLGGRLGGRATWHGRWTVRFCLLHDVHTALCGRCAFSRTPLGSYSFNLTLAYLRDTTFAHRTPSTEGGRDIARRRAAASHIHAHGCNLLVLYQLPRFHLPP